MKSNNLWYCLVLLSASVAAAAEYHVSVGGDDAHDGSAQRPLRTIQRAAERAQPGDTITVHEGVYRERVDPPRGGLSDEQRIIYRAAPGAKVVIKGSEVVTGWARVEGGVWKVVLPNAMFGAYNPYTDVIGTDWFNDRGRPHHTGEVYLNNKSLYEVVSLAAVKNPKPLPHTTDPAGSLYVWYAEVDDETTTLYANFHEFNPNEERVEINVREACFYPSEPGRNYITVRGFHMSQAATQWSTATDEQIGLIGTHWSKGWMIENNVISHSKNAGITLGKDRKSGHRAWAKDRSKPGHVVYNEVIQRALEGSGWSRENIGHHVVRNNTIFDCEKNGIHGSLGGVFSRIENNHIYNIYTKRQFFGHDLAGIKFLGAIDMLIQNNRIHDAFKGIWLDWMTQGTRVHGNLLYRNDSEDLFLEVNHGPFVVDNNVCFSNVALRDWSHGGAYLHNLFAGNVVRRTVHNRRTPYHEPHSTAVRGLERIYGGDNRFFNNIFIGHGLHIYDGAHFPVHAGGNVYLRGARPMSGERNFLAGNGSSPDLTGPFDAALTSQTVAVVFRWSENASEWFRPFSQSDAEADYRTAGHYIPIVRQADSRVFGAHAGGGFRAGHTVPPDRWTLFTATHCGARLRNRVDGGEAAGFDHALDKAFTRYTVGSAFGSHFLDGDIAEVIVLGAALPDADRRRLEGYLAHKWGLQANLPDDHPHKNAPEDGWTPRQLPDVALWLDAADAGTVTAGPAGGVSQWRDKSGHARHAAHAGGAEARQPVHRSGALSGRAVMAFGLPDPPVFELVEEDDHVYLHVTGAPALGALQSRLITTEHLGKARIPDLPFKNHDGSFLKIDTDYGGSARSETHPIPGPLEGLGEGEHRVRVW